MIRARILLSGIFAAILLVPLMACAHDDSEEAIASQQVGPGSIINFRYIDYGPLYDQLEPEFKGDFKRLANGDPYFDENDYQVIGIYEADLNNDLIPEIFVNFANEFLYCKEEGWCHNYVVSITDGKVVRLGFFEFSRIAIAESETNGVIDLKIYQNPLNIYQYRLAKWNADKQTYEIEE